MAINNKRLSQSYSIKGEYNIQCRYTTLNFKLRTDLDTVSSSLIALCFIICVCEFKHESVVYKYFMKIDFNAVHIVWGAG